VPAHGRSRIGVVAALKLAATDLPAGIKVSGCRETVANASRKAAGKRIVCLTLVTRAQYFPKDTCWFLLHWPGRVQSWPSDSTRAMKCPDCKHEFRLTVREYLREPGGRHNCPACGTRFRLKYSVSYVVLLIMAEIITAAVPALLVFRASNNLLLCGFTFVVCSLVFVVPLDFYLDDRWRESIKL